MDLVTPGYFALAGVISLVTVIGYGKSFFRSRGKHRRPVALESVTYLTELANGR